MRNFPSIMAHGSFLLKLSCTDYGLLLNTMHPFLRRLVRRVGRVMVVTSTIDAIVMAGKRSIEGL